MKNVINYFYNFNIDNIRMIDDNYYFINGGENYVFYEIKESLIDDNTVFQINALLINNERKFYQIIPNINNKIMTYNSNKKYILMKMNLEQDRDFDYYDIQKTNIIVDEYNKKTSKLVRTNWGNLWENKIDYFEWFIEHNINKYPKLNKYYNYFIGLAENAVLYFKDTVIQVKPNVYDQVVISHKRMNDKYTFNDLYNPIILVVDHPTRDLAEYLKMIFWNKKYENNQYQQWLNKINLSNYGARMLLSRMLYPSFFFDSCEKLFNNKLNEKHIFYIIDRMIEYESYLCSIYEYLKKRYYIPKIEWIKKVDYSSTLTTPNTSGTSFISIDSIPSLSVTSIMLQ